MAGLIAAAIGCGNKSAPESTLSPSDRGFGQSHAAGSGSAAGESGTTAAAAVSRFHDTLAPRWHAERSPQRMTDTCAVTAQLRSEAAAIAAATPPAGADAAGWAGATKQLGEAVTTLEAACKTSDAAGFEPAFASVHERFHGVMEAAGGHHDEHAPAK